MSSTSPELAVGQSVAHAEMGAGVFVGLGAEGYARVFFQRHGERQVPLTALAPERSWEEQVVANAHPATPDALLRLWLAIEAEQLPLLENAASLTAAKVDLLPHQIVLTYRIANASPRRFLVADSVGLGKTIETALVLRELASRGELTRALMVVPAGLVENWRRELNDTFHLDFEVFGSDGDVTDRKSNAFAKHNRLIASIDTLKRPARVKRLLEAPLWDLIVFDEAHHLTAYRSGNRVTRTQNFRLGEELRNHSRDLLLLSATPHDHADGESESAGEEEIAAALVSVAIPAERCRIQELLAMLPRDDESKTLELLRGVEALWAVRPEEKIVIFTTYLGSVDALRTAIETRFQGVGVEVLKGGDQGAKLAAERRFRRPNGPRVLICTAAGREGINLQFARVLFNHDLPWNPMDVEQRIGRIHRYGQVHTAQVYNIVSADTIEGKIFLLLEEKLLEIAKALGKVDERGQISEDLREQVLGQLSERLSYDKLYQDAVRDPTLRRSRQELDVALENARTARQVVSELFQDLEGFRLDDYKQFDDGGKGIERLLRFVQEGVQAVGGTVTCKGPTMYETTIEGGQVRFTTDRDRAKQDENLTLLGVEHQLVRLLMQTQRNLPAAQRCLVGKGDGRDGDSWCPQHLARSDSRRQGPVPPTDRDHRDQRRGAAITASRTASRKTAAPGSSPRRASRRRPTHRVGSRRDP